MKNILSHVLFILAVKATFAQAVYRDVVFKQGDRYEKTIAIKSTSVIQRGEQKLTLDGDASVSGSYVVSDTIAGKYTFNITIEKVTDTLKGMGRQMDYNSEKPSGAASVFAKMLNRLIGKSTEVVTGKTGKITAVSENLPLGLDDSLINLSNLVPDKFVVGNTIDLIAKFPAPDFVKKGCKWTDTILTTGGKEIIQYTIDKVADSTIMINFKGNAVKDREYRQGGIINKDHSTSAITGYMIVDNTTAIVTNRFIKTDESGFETIGNISVSTQKKRTVIETVKKLRS